MQVSGLAYFSSKLTEKTQSEQQRGQNIAISIAFVIGNEFGRLRLRQRLRRRPFTVNFFPL